MTKEITFYKYQGTGNDFIITTDLYKVTTDQIISLCDRKYGIGADGLIVMRKGGTTDFDMMYYNADGSESFCGNGSRCAAKHAAYLGWVSGECTFKSNDGEHTATIEDDEVKLKMHDVDMVLVEDEGYMLNTGSPHYIAYTEELEELDLITAAHAIRYNDNFKEVGINVNYLEAKNGILYMRTYERGVEDETLSCGTGATAAAIAHYLEKESTVKKFSQKIQTKGGALVVTFSKKDTVFSNIYLCGPAVQVYSGKISI
ncbi:MAG: diaminopimelate epimerase [Bacteroidia bacterium]|jgi:diaminopimelate epimerase|tara:strand:+ start:438 stop:1211 length:774 start_codon:yes stop_codon:yes gene_type:complete